MRFRISRNRSARVAVRFLVRFLRAGLAGLAGLLLASIHAPALAQSNGWSPRLLAELARIDAEHRGAIGVHVRDLDTGQTASYQGDKYWYLASMVKVPVAIAVLRGVEAGHYTLDTPLTLRASDYVDGAGPTSGHPIGTPLTIRYLMDQMIIYSDNTATDMLIGLAGIAEVNETLQSLVPEGFKRITTLGEVRRQIYGYLVAGTDKLSGRDLLLLKRQRSDAERMTMLAHMVDTPITRFRLPTLEAAYSAYYGSGLNNGRLDAYAQLLALLVDGKALTPTYTDYLLKVMTRVATGTHRIKAGLPLDVSFAHKTGTQRRRICDAGLVRAPDALAPGHQRRVVIVACVRDEPSLERSEFALMQVGAALCKSGLITQGIPDAPSCHNAPLAGRLPAADERKRLRSVELGGELE